MPARHEWHVAERVIGVQVREDQMANGVRRDTRAQQHPERAVAAIHQPRAERRVDDARAWHAPQVGLRRARAEQGDFHLKVCFKLYGRRDLLSITGLTAVLKTG